MQSNPVLSPETLFLPNDTILDASGGINYNVHNPVVKLIATLESSWFFAADPEHYLNDSLQFLFPFSHLELYGPAGTDHGVLDPRQQDNKTDFQKQNIRDFTLTDTWLARGWAQAGEWTVPFLKVSYTGGPDAKLSSTSGNQLSDFIYLWIRVQGTAGNELIKVPYNEQTDRYEVEIWGYPDGDQLFDMLGEKGKAALKQGRLIVRNDLIKGTKKDFSRESLDGQDLFHYQTGHTMHPLLPLNVELAWTDHTQTYWDSLEGRNYRYQFNMLLRGWDNYMEVGVSGNPHGGLGFLHYRNLFSNYKPNAVQGELGRQLLPWMFNAFGRKGETNGSAIEPFLAVDYMDLHVLKPDCAIGIHRHRDNQEVFFLLTGKAFMMTGDWYHFPDRERAFEIRTLIPGSMTLLKAGQLHALINALDIDSSLLMFGGYD